jgi:hypothetical protein
MKFTAIGNIFSAQILGFTPCRPRKNSEAVRCFPLFFAVIAGAARALKAMHSLLRMIPYSRVKSKQYFYL